MCAMILVRDSYRWPKTSPAVQRLQGGTEISTTRPTATATAVAAATTITTTATASASAAITTTATASSGSSAARFSNAS